MSIKNKFLLILNILYVRPITFYCQPQAEKSFKCKSSLYN